MRSVLAVFVLSALSACSKPAPPPPPPPGPPPIDEAAAKQGVDALWAKAITADTSANADAFMTLFADDARVDVQGAPAMVGKAAIDKAIRPMLANRKPTAYQAAAHTTTVISNELVYQGGTYNESYVEKKKTKTDYGRFIAALTKGGDGQWRFGYYMAIIDSTRAGRESSCHDSPCSWPGLPWPSPFRPLPSPRRLLPQPDPTPPRCVPRSTPS